MDQTGLPSGSVYPALSKLEKSGLAFVKSGMTQTLRYLDLESLRRALGGIEPLE